MWFKFSKYQPGTFFKPHFDSPYVKNENERSIYTLMIFLNDDFSGGQTNFFERSIPITEDYNVPLLSVKPKTGRALFFNHDTRHEGEPVRSGTKYILRTEIVFKRMNSTPITQWKADPQYREAVDLYLKSSELEKEGNVDASSAAFLKALHLQAQYKSIDVSTLDSDTTPKWFLSDIMIHIMHFLPDISITNLMAVNKKFLNLALDNRVWQPRLQTMWPELYKIEKVIDSDDYIKDWYSCYKTAFTAYYHAKPVIFDFGEFSVKYLGTFQPEEVINVPVPSVTANVKGGYHCTVDAIPDDDSIRVGYEIATRFCTSHTLVMFEGKLDDPNALKDLIRWIYKYGFALQGEKPSSQATLSGLLARDPPEISYEPSEHPVLIADSFLGFPDTDKEIIKYIFFEILKVPRLLFADPAFLSLSSIGRQTGVVVHSGYNVTAVVPVWKGVVEQKLIIPFAGKKSVSLAQDSADSRREYYLSLFEEEEVERRTDLMFQPRKYGLQTKGLPELVYDVIMMCHEVERDELFQNILLSCGHTLCEGFSTRFESELKQLHPKCALLLPNVPPDQSIVFGGRIVASSTSFQNSCISRENYKPTEEFERYFN